MSMNESGGVDDKRMKLRYAGRCRLCGAELPQRSEAIYERASKTVRCVECAEGPLEPPSDEAESPAAEPTPRAAEGAGSSARRMYERRKAKDEERIRAKWGRFGGIAVALSDERQSTTAWERGAVGEERLGARLDRLDSAEFVVLHDRLIPGTRANIDHMVVTRSGVWVIDAKHYKGRPTLKVEGGILRPRTEKLLVGRRDRTKTVDSAVKQVELVRQVVGPIPVKGCLCFVGADWPLIGGTFRTRGIDVLWPRRLTKALLAQRGGDVDVRAVGALLADRFKPA